MVIIKQIASCGHHESIQTLWWLWYKTSTMVIINHETFLSDPSPIIWIPLLLTDWLTNCCLVNLMWPWHAKMPTQNFLRLLPLHDVDAEKCVWCSFGSWSLVIKIILCSGFEHEVCSRFWSWSSGEILKLKFGQYFAAVVCLRLWSWILVKILLLGRDSEAKFGHDFEF